MRKVWIKETNYRICLMINGIEKGYIASGKKRGSQCVYINGIWQETFRTLKDAKTFLLNY